MLSTEPVATSAPPSAADLAQAISEYLRRHASCVVMEAGRALFAMENTQYTVRESGSACTLHLWSESANAVRRVTAATAKGDNLRLAVWRLGQRRSQMWELRPAGTVRSANGRDHRRRDALRQLERVLQREFPDERLAGFRAAMDLEHSFGPAYLRGEMARARERTAVVAVGAGESQATVDGALSVALLWLEHSRERAAGAGLHVGGVRIIVPRGMAATTASRLRWLRGDAARFELYTLDAREGLLCRIDPLDAGNSVTQLVRAADPAAALERFATSIAAVLELLPAGCEVVGLVARGPHPEKPGYRFAGDVGASASSAAHRNCVLPAAPQPPLCEVRLRSPGEIAFLCHGLEFARIRPGFAQGSFRRLDQITVGSGAAETHLTGDNAGHLRAVVSELFHRRHSGGSLTADTLARTQPERWLESALRRDLAALDPELAPEPVYTQLPAFTGAGASLDRGMLDLLAVTRGGRLAIVEIKVHEDMELAMQGLDYWIRVREHHLSRVDPATGLGSLQQHGYFPATRLTPEAPRLYLVAPALHIHPATETILRHFSPEVSWTLVALDERWRSRIRPVWARRSSGSPSRAEPL